MFEKVRNRSLWSIVAGLSLVSVMIGSALTVQGCFKQTETEVVVEVPHVETVAENARSLAKMANAFVLNDETAAGIADLMNYVVDNVDAAEGSTSQFMLNTVDEAVKAGKVPESFRLLLVGLVNIVNNYFEIKDFNLNDFIVICRAFVDGLQDNGVTAQSIQLNF